MEREASRRDPESKAKHAAKRKRPHRLLRVLAVIGAVAVALAAAFFIYVSDYSHATPRALESAQSDERITVQQLEGAVAFVPQDPIAGFVFYPGAKVDPLAYAPLMRACAERNILAVVVEPPFNLALLDIGAAARVPAQFPQVRSWMVGGHSMGGVAASSCLAQDPGAFDALALLASYPDADLSSFAGKAVSIRGSNDQVLNMDKYRDAWSKLPSGTGEIVIDGGNHAGFGDYGTQKGDGEASVSGNEQQSIAADAIASLAATSLPEPTGDGGTFVSETNKRIALESKIERTLASMTLAQKVAQLFVVQPESLDDLGEDGIDPLTAYPVGGFLYMGGHLEDPGQTRAMLADTQQRSLDAIGLPVFLCVDEEGGTVARVAGNPAFGVGNVGDMQAIGASGDTAAAYDAALYIGSYLVDLGFNVDFAPVADLADGDDSMAWRSFGTNADSTAEMVSAQVEGFTQAGILCAVKHYPGIGGIAEDSHNSSIFSHLSADEFRSTALKPFASGIDAGATFVMAGHLSTPEATGDDVPASLSRTWLTDVLRGELKFDGLAITDSLGMGAVYDRYPQSEVGALAIDAGADMLLNPPDFLAMYQGILDAVARGELSESRIDESVRRILRVKITSLDQQAR